MSTPRPSDEFQRRQEQLSQELASLSSAREGLHSRNVLDSIPTLVKAVGPDYRILLWNEECEATTGYTAAEMLGNPNALRMMYPQPGRVEEILAEVERRGATFKNWEVPLTTKNGSERIIAWSSVPNPSDIDPGWVLCTVGVDVTDRDFAQIERDRFFNLSIDMLSVADLESRRFLQLNPSWQRCLGWSNEELSNQEIGDFVHPDDQERTAEARKTLIDGQIVSGFVNRYQCKDGSYRWLSWSAFGDIKNNRIYSIARDVTDTHRMERDLRRSEQRYRDLVETSPFGIVMHSGTELLFLNRAAHRMFGAEDGALAGTDAMDRIAPEYQDEVRDRIGALFSGHDLATMDQKFVRVDGTTFWARVWSSVVQHHGEKVAQVIFTDVTDHRRAEEDQHELQEQLHQAQKMESIGQLAGGVAHDFNNILTGINGFAELVLGELSEDDPLRKPIIEIRRAGARAADLTQQLLAFSRRQPVAPRHVNVNEILSNARTMLDRIIGEDVHLEFQPDPDLWSVHFDPNQLEQVVLNLATNSRDAMPGGGQLRISTQNVELESASIDGQPVDSRHWVEIAVADTGEGMSPGVARQAFEPFFSTKELGKGTGLGLSTVYGIVKQNHGFIHLDSTEGEGARFRILLPRSEAAPTVRESPRDLQPTEGGCETVLVVEDEPMVRDLTESILTQNGYRVLTANDADGAKVVLESASRLDLLLTDVVLPGQNGKDLFDSVRASAPGLRVLYMSGYSENILSERGIRDEGVAFVGKPFSVDELLTAVRDALSD